MKILIASDSCIYNEKYPELRKNVGGFGIMINALARMFGKSEDVYVLTQSNLTKGRRTEDFKVVKKTFLDLLVSFSPFYIVRALKIIRQDDCDFYTKTRTLIYYLTGRYCEKVIKRNKIDVVHINGIGNPSLPYIYACARTNTPFVLTIHGLLSFDKSVDVIEFSKRFEREYFKFVSDKNSFNTVISTGCKRRLEEALNTTLSQVDIVLNPIIEFGENQGTCITKKEGERIILCIGNVSERKNQRLIVEAFSQLDIREFENISLYIIGGNEYELKKFVEQNNIKNIYFTGSISRDNVKKYLEVADLLVTAAVDEGFGLPIIEGYYHGVPAVFPKAIDAFSDVYSEECAICPDEYESELFSIIIRKALDKKWDSARIKKYAQKFGEDHCCEQYMYVLKKSYKSGGCWINTEQLDKILEQSLAK